MIAAEEGAHGPELPAPIFVGGTGRSGTHAMSRLLGRHSTIFYFSREMRFHTDSGGFPDLLSGRITVDQFVQAMRGRFWRRTGNDGKPRGLWDKLSWASYEAALEAFRARAEDDLPGACRLLMHALLDPLAREAGKRTWLEQTPPTVAAAETLYSIFPTMRMIHMVRDGRDVACSVVRKEWGPSSVTRAIPWWEERLRACHAATAAIPRDRFIIVHLEDLVEGKRARTYKRVLRFLGIEDEPAMRRYFKRQMTAEAANVGRWRSELPEPMQRKLNRLYRESLERMARDGIRGPRTLERAGLADAPAGRERSWFGRATAR